ncbi:MULTISPECIES: hypothetical protein [unclassified Enterococcus]|uniref:hypothetical protein n=1 Tax=unclassified Enterococcus TaxID=2608891 RepID=UPI00155312C2|nr:MULTISPECIES: hypothetical protein [unclassified Enterococcus]MBS7576879.1 hypothetical protein [Enterococcus sp. MMGLQ5-2]MBS7584286.1 hypothetical protein [Enterococcus sp. MMGLQ5-1]NPD12142.1 hypothetical protein [Enterococcus sp. MMGLQ5-1]NPD36714.1 hypothetical protein [Enterococcus sp. MMGLQ5-2]
MKIYYPPLVEQANELIDKYKHPRAQAATKADIYRLLVSKQLLAENGAPTAAAVAKGYVKDYYEAADLNFNAFLELYPVFTQFDSALFRKIGGFWEIPIDFKDYLLAEISQDTFDYDEQIALESYFSERNIKLK